MKVTSILFLTFFVNMGLAQEIRFSDPKLAEQVLDQADINKDGVLQVDEAISLGELSLTGTGIKTAEDLAYFPGLQKLKIVGTAINYLELRDMFNLSYLECTDNKNLQELIVVSCPVLKEIKANKNNLRSVKIENLPKLWTLNVVDNQLTAIDTKGMPGVGNLLLNKNNLTSLDITPNKKLINLGIADNPDLKILDITGNPDYMPQYMSHDEGLQIIGTDKQMNRHSTGPPPEFISD